MALFTFKKSQKRVQDSPNSRVKILGSGCANCTKLEEHTRQALQQLGMDLSIEHVTDIVAIAGYGVMATPALVLDGKVLSSGRVLSKEEVVTLLKSSESGL